MSKDILIKNGKIMDGTGKPSYNGDILIENEYIIDIGTFTKEEASFTIDASNLTVAPGFIDVHSHLDFLIASSRHVKVLETWIRQGVTTIVAGNCGYSPAPINHKYEDLISKYWNFALPYDGLKFEWNTMVEFFEFLNKNKLALNVAILTGHNTLRTNIMGFQARFANSNEIDEMKRMLKESIDAGSIGLSLGLGYVPGIFSNTDEVLKLASVLTEYRLPIVPHTRGLLSKIYDKAIEEVILIAEQNKIPLHISHHAGGGIGRSRKLALRKIEDAMNRGVKISHDNIPWPNTSTTALSLFPPWLFDGGLDNFFMKLQDYNMRQEVINEMKNFTPKWPPWENKYWTDREFNDNFLLGGFRKKENKRFENMRIKDVANLLNRDAIDAFIDLVIDENGKIYTISGQFDNLLAEDFVCSLLSDPNCSVGTDIVAADFETISPVAYGAFTKVLGQLARDKSIMTQEEAVRKMTSLPAMQMHLKDRGIIKKGAFADITIFNPATVKNNASYTHPFQPSEGIEYVIINGIIVLEKNKFHNDTLAGKVLKRNS